MKQNEEKKMPLPILQASVEDLWRIGQEMGLIGLTPKDSSFSDSVYDREFLGIPVIVTGVKAVAKELKISVSTVNRMLSEGIIDDGVYRYGRTLIFNLHVILRILKKRN